MAYMSQERKRALAPAIKKILTKYGLKGSLSVDNHSSLVLTVKQGVIDFYEDLIWTDQDAMYRNRQPKDKFEVSVNQYYIKDHWKGKGKEFLSEVYTAMSVGNHDNSDTMTDYFDVGWYIDIKIGKWDAPYNMVK